MIFLSAGHNLKDSGAVANGYSEAELTMELRDGIAKHLGKIVTDKDSESLSQYLKRIQTGSGSVVLDLHFNAGAPTANGAECFVANESSREMATELCDLFESVGFKNRGVKTEAQSQHNRLAILHDGAKVAVLAEICFITNNKDLGIYFANFDKLCVNIAAILEKWDAKYS